MKQITSTVCKGTSAPSSPRSRRREARAPRSSLGRAIVASILVGVSVSACSLAPKFTRPEMEMPAGWSQVDNVGLKSEQDGVPFWQALGSEELNRLVERALSQNLDLEAALHRIEQARAQAKVAGSSLYPSVQVSGNSSRTMRNPADTSAAQSATLRSEEVDLWG